MLKHTNMDVDLDAERGFFEGDNLTLAAAPLPLGDNFAVIYDPSAGLARGVTKDAVGFPIDPDELRPLTDEELMEDLGFFLRRATVNRDISACCPFGDRDDEPLKEGEKVYVDVVAQEHEGMIEVFLNPGDLIVMTLPADALGEKRPSIARGVSGDAQAGATYTPRKAFKDDFGKDDGDIPFDQDDCHRFETSPSDIHSACMLFGLDEGVAGKLIDALLTFAEG